MRALFVVVCMLLGGMAGPALAQSSGRTPPATLRLTGEQWACLQTRLPNLQRLPTNVVRVPLSPCNQGSGVRGPGASNVTAGNARAIEASNTTLTRSPLYLSQAHLACIQRQLPALTGVQGASQVDLTKCS